jgi:hypothetical protein
MEAFTDIGRGRLEVRVCHGQDSKTQMIQSRFWQDRYGVVTGFAGCPRGAEARRLAGYNEAMFTEIARRFGTNWYFNSLVEAELERRAEDYRPNRFE